MSNDDPKSLEELKKELSFYRNQTKVLRDKNRDLRNALLMAESTESTETQKKEDSTKESLSDIRKIISDSKKQISDKLNQFKDTMKENGQTTTAEQPATAATSTPASDSSGAPTPPKFSLSMDGSSDKSQPTQSSPVEIPMEVEVLNRQVEYLKEEVERLETFLDQSEMVNNRLRELLSKHSIDVSEISQAINEASKTAVSHKAVIKEPKIEPAKTEVIPEPVIRKPSTVAREQAAVSSTTQKQSQVTSKPAEKKLDPEIAKLFNDLRGKLNRNIDTEEIKLEILNLREQLMDLIPHSRVFYEMQVEYRKWKRGTSSVDQLKKVMSDWEKTIASM